MKILFLTSYADPGSGASVLLRLACQVQKRGHEVKIITTQPGFGSDLVEVIELPRYILFLNRVVNRVTPNYFNFSCKTFLDAVRRYKPDIVNLHWTHGYTIPLKILPRVNSEVPLFWTIHDLWPITANSFFEFSGGKRLSGTGSATLRKTISRLRFSPGILLGYKVRLLGDVRMHTISPSAWLRALVNESPVFRASVNHHIPNGVDTEVFRCLDRHQVRARYGIPQDQFVVLFLAANLGDERKGFYYFMKAVEHLGATRPELMARITTVLVGANSQGAEQYLRGNVKVLCGTRDVSQLVEYYNLADVFVSTSLADNFPSTSLESCACGTPVVAFNVGGVPEIVLDGKTGLLAESKDYAAVADNISQILNDAELLEEMRKNCREHVSGNFSMKKFVDGYIEQFESELMRRDKARMFSA